MVAQATPVNETDRQLKLHFEARLEQEVARLREESRTAVADFKRSFPPPTDAQIERLLYPELAEFAVELGGRRFALREMPALEEKKFLRLVEQKLPALVAEILSFDERLGEPAGGTADAFARVLERAGSALDLVAEACALVLDPAGAAGLTREFVQRHASTARQLRILKAQLLINGARDFLSRLFPALREVEPPEGPVPKVAPAVTPISPPQSPGSNSCGIPPASSQLVLPWGS